MPMHYLRERRQLLRSYCNTARSQSHATNAMGGASMAERLAAEAQEGQGWRPRTRLQAD